MRWAVKGDMKTIDVRTGKAERAALRFENETSSVLRLVLAGAITRFMKMRTCWRSSSIERVRRMLRGFSCRLGRRGTARRKPQDGRRWRHETEACYYLW